MALICECSSHQRNYLELLHFLSRNYEDSKRVIFSETPRHNKLTSPHIQKDITQAAAKEITNMIIKDLGDSLFSILIYKSRDISIKEQVEVVIWYVDNNGYIIECFLVIQHVSNTTTSSLKVVIKALFSKHVSVTSLYDMFKSKWLFLYFQQRKAYSPYFFYPNEFSIVDLTVLGDQLDTYIIDLCDDNKFSGIEGIASTSLAEKMVKTKKILIFSLVYILIKLSLLLSVTTAIMKRVFSAMHIVKSWLWNRMRDKKMNDNLVVYIKKDIFDKIDNEVIITQFQNIKTQRKQL